MFGIVFGVLQTFGQSDTIKSALKESGFYQNAVSNALDQAQKNKPGDEKNEIPLDRPEMQSIIKDAVSPEYLQTQTEGTLDSTYAWLQGKTDKLAFSIDLADAKTRLANGVEQYAKQHLGSLPVCTAGSMPAGDLDPFQATCLPQGANINTIAANAKNEMLQGEFLKDSQITADSIKTDEKSGQTLAEKVKDVPQHYQNAVWGTYALGALALLLGVGIVFLSVNWRSGLKKFSILLIIAGVFGAAIGWLAGFGGKKLAEELSSKEPLQQSAGKVGQHLANDLHTWWLWYGIILAVVGIIVLVVLHLTKPKDASEEIEHINEPTGETLPVTLATEQKSVVPPAKPRPRPGRRLVQ